MNETARARATDRELVDRARNGDAEAMDLLVRRHYDAVYRTGLSILRADDLAQDAAQETFVRAVRGIRRFRGESAFRTWVLSIAANEARGLLRRRSRIRETSAETLPEEGEADPDVVDRIQLRETARDVRRLLEDLPEKQRLAVSLRIFEGLSFREVGELIGSSEGAARVNYHHGVRRLREWLNDA